MKQYFELDFVVEYGYEGLATFEILWKSVGEYGGDVNDDDDDKDEHPANIHRNSDYPVNVIHCMKYTYYCA